MADGGERETLQLFHLTFKLILKEASSSALVQFINRLFGTDYPPDSKVVFHATESVSADAEKLEKLTSDMIITIAGDAFLIEAQISDDGNMALMILERMVWMHEELSRRYSEFKEADMELRERLRTKWQDYLQEGLTRGMQLGEQEGRGEADNRAFGARLYAGRNKAEACP